MLNPTDTLPTVRFTLELERVSFDVCVVSNYGQSGFSRNVCIFTYVLHFSIVVETTEDSTVFGLIHHIVYDIFV